MKKLIVLSVIALLICCGCSKTNTTTPILDNISFTAQINYDKQEYVCDVVITESVLNIVVSEPEQIKGLTVKVDKNGTMAEFMGISYTPDLNSLPQGAVAQVLFSVLEDAAEKSAVYVNENCEIDGNVNGYEYDFTFSPSGLPLSLVIEDLDLEINFNNTALK